MRKIIHAVAVIFTVIAAIQFPVGEAQAWEIKHPKKYRQPCLETNIKDGRYVPQFCRVHKLRKEAPRWTPPNWR